MNDREPVFDADMPSLEAERIRQEQIFGPIRVARPGAIIWYAVLASTVLTCSFIGGSLVGGGYAGGLVAVVVMTIIMSALSRRIGSAGLVGMPVVPLVATVYAFPLFSTGSSWPQFLLTAFFCGWLVLLSWVVAVGAASDADREGRNINGHWVGRIYEGAGLVMVAAMRTDPKLALLILVVGNVLLAVYGYLTRQASTEFCDSIL